MIVWPEEEWRKRINSTICKSLRNMILMFIAIYFTPFLSLYFLEGPDVYKDGGFRDVLLIGIGLVIYMAILFYIVLKLKNRIPASGLYERGIQVRPHLFMPYEEISEVDTTIEGWWFWKEESVDMYVKYKSHQRWPKSPPRCVSLSKWVLEVKGLQELTNRVDFHNE